MTGQDTGADARPLDFSTYLMSLGMSVLVQLGEAPDPTGASAGRDLLGARQNIDLLGLLEQKTRGNLEPTEERLLHNLLRDLRVKYVRAAGGK